VLKYDSIETFARMLWGDKISEPQIVCLKALVGESLSWSQRAIWRRLSELPLFTRYAPRQYWEAVWIFARQCGKSHQLGTTIILWTIYCMEHEVEEGSRLSVLCFSPVLRQSIFDVVVEKIASISELQEQVEVSAPASGEVRFKNGIDLLSISANPAYARGKTAILCVVDEAAFLHTDTEFTNNLTDLLESIRPSLIVKQGRLLLMSSPGGMEGPLFESWRDREANRNDVQVLRAPSILLNPTIDKKLLERERARGESYYRREFLAEFTELSGNPFLNPEFINRAAKGSPAEFEPDKKDQFVFSGLDLADRKDWCAQSIATVRLVDGVRKVIVLSCRIWKPDSSGHKILTVLEEMGQQCKKYGVYRANGDQKSMSAAEGVLAPFNVQFKRVISAGAGSEAAYRSFSALLNENRLILPDNSELLSQLKKLEERLTDGSRFLVQARRSGKDDAAVSCVLAVAMAVDNLETPSEPWAQCVPIFDDDDGPAAEFGRPPIPGTGGWTKLF
jgi:hypothetical protein